MTESPWCSVCKGLRGYAVHGSTPMDLSPYDEPRHPFTPEAAPKWTKVVDETAGHRDIAWDLVGPDGTKLAGVYKGGYNGYPWSYSIKGTIVREHKRASGQSETLSSAKAFIEYQLGLRDTAY